mmetsp:Transcript_17140/g.39969  ORF Transcript_17140/g.39969 Transcript_17140/m.39969 type:complete len:209 (-) Transcript_17140:124-750(-)
MKHGCQRREWATKQSDCSCICNVFLERIVVPLRVTDINRIHSITWGPTTYCHHSRETICSCRLCCHLEQAHLDWILDNHWPHHLPIAHCVWRCEASSANVRQGSAIDAISFAKVLSKRRRFWPASQWPLFLEDDEREEGHLSRRRWQHMHTLHLQILPGNQQTLPTRIRQQLLAQPQKAERAKLHMCTRGPWSKHPGGGVCHRCIAWR